jgi:hypothetical protein
MRREPYRDVKSRANYSGRHDIQNFNGCTEKGQIGTQRLIAGSNNTIKKWAFAFRV